MSLSLRLQAHSGAAGLSPRYEELLFGRKSVHDGNGGESSSSAEAPQRDVDAGEIGDGLAQHPLAIMVHTRLYEIAIELIDHALTALIELLTVGIGPPICWMSLQVVGSPQAVDEVRQIMRDRNAKGPIVDRIRGVGIEERRLQYACRQYYFIQFHDEIAVRRMTASAWAARSLGVLACRPVAAPRSR